MRAIFSGWSSPSRVRWWSWSGSGSLAGLRSSPAAGGQRFLPRRSGCWPYVHGLCCRCGRVELRPGKGRFDIRWERVPGAAPDECDQRAADTCAAGGGDLPGASGRRPAMGEYGGCCPGPAGCGACDVCAADVEGISGFVLRRHWCGSDRRLFVASPHVINSDQHPPRGGSGSRLGMWVAETRSDNRQRFSRQSRVPAGQPSRELARKSTILPAPSIVSGLAASDHSRFHRLPSQVRTDRQEQAERTLHRRAGP